MLLKLLILIMGELFERLLLLNFSFEPQSVCVNFTIRVTNDGADNEFLLRRDLKLILLRQLCDWLTLSQSLPHWLIALSRINLQALLRDSKS